MSLEKRRTSEPSPLLEGEGRRESPLNQQLEEIHRTGGVSEDSMSGSVFRRSRETLQSEGQNSTLSTSPSRDKAWWALQGVRVLHSSVEAPVMGVERRRGTCVNVVHRRKGSGDGE